MEVGESSGQAMAEFKSADKRSCGMGLGPMLLIGAVAILLAFHGFRKTRFQPGRTNPTIWSSQSNHAKFDPNTANLRELSLIPGLGPSLAEKLVEFRREKRLTRPEDLLEIHGIGPATVGKLEQWFVWVERDSIEEVRKLPAEKFPEKNQGNMPFVRSAKLKAGDPKLDINTAGSEDLVRLPGVGPALVRRIIEEREVKPFSSVDDLMRVPGIGPKTFAKIKSMINVGNSEKNGK